MRQYNTTPGDADLFLARLISFDNRSGPIEAKLAKLQGWFRPILAKSSWRSAQFKEGCAGTSLSLAPLPSMKIRSHSESHLVELDDGSKWQIFPGDLDVTLNWKPDTELSSSALTIQQVPMPWLAGMITAVSEYCRWRRMAGGRGAYSLERQSANSHAPREI